MKLNPDEKACLENLYLQLAVATDQLRRVPIELRAMVAAFNQMTGREERASDLVRYMRNRRKNKDWPLLGGRARKFESAFAELDEDHLDVLEELYVEIDQTVDELDHSTKLASVLRKKFSARTGMVLPASRLVAALMAMRKAGLLPCIREEKSMDVGFDDIDDVIRDFGT